MSQHERREKLRAFLLRRKTNAMGLLVLTIMCAVISLLCAFSDFPHTDLLLLVTGLLILLCFVQAFKLRKSFRTIHTSSALRRKRKRPEAS